MATTTRPTSTPLPTTPTPTMVARGRVGGAIDDGLAVAARNLRGMRRVPEVIVFSTIQPVIFVLMFVYVFGGAISVPGVNYVDFLMPGVFVQTVLFGGMNTVAGMSDDLGKGLIERFRSLPIARSAVLVGRTLADLVRNVGVIALMVVVGMLVGYRVQTGIVEFAIAMGLLVIFSFAVSWMFCLFALSAPTPEAAQAAAFPPMALLVFASSAFVPTEGMPGWLQVWANNQPVSVVVDAIRALTLGGATAGDVFKALAWSVGLVVVFGALAVRRYHRAV